MSATLRNLTVTFGSLVDKGANPGAHILLFKRDESQPTVRTENATMPAEAAAMLAKIDPAKLLTKVGRKMAGPRMAALKVAIEHLNQILSECSAERGEPADDDKEPDMAKKNDAPAVDEAPEVTPETAPVVEKAAETEDVAKQLSDLAKRAEAAEARAAEAEGIAKAERDQRLTGEYVAKAKAFSALPADAAKLGPILKRAAEALSDEDNAELHRIFAAASEAIGKSVLFTEVGKTGAEDGGNAWSKIEALAKEAIAADPKLTIEKARVAVMQAHPDLKAAHYAERAGAH